YPSTDARGSQRGVPGFAGADAGCGGEIEHENLAIADAFGAGSLLNRFHDLRRDGIRRCDFDLYLGQHIRRIFGPAVNLGLALLPPEALDFRHGHACDAYGAESFAYLVELERFDDGDDEFHLKPPDCLPATIHRLD